MAGMGMIVAGAMEGWSEGRLGEIKAEREAKIQALADARADKRTAADQQFRSQEAAIGADRQVAENKRQEGVAAVEKQKDRELTILKGADKPADQQMVEYLQSIGKTQEEALDWVKTSRGKSEEDSKLALYRAHVAAGLSTEEANQATEEAWAKYGKSSAAADPYAGDRTAPAGPSKVTKDKPGALRAPPGDGSEHRPFKASQQADVDWFKKYAKPGDMIEYGGTIYTK